MKTAYMDEQWFALLRAAAKAQGQLQAAEMLGLSVSTLRHVLYGLGLYGSGKASTERIADKVMHTFGRYECPFLTANSLDDERKAVLVTADDCRKHAYRKPPTNGSPFEVQHWSACQGCRHKAAVAPVAPAVVALQPRTKGAAR